MVGVISSVSVIGCVSIRPELEGAACRTTSPCDPYRLANEIHKNDMSKSATTKGACLRVEDVMIIALPEVRWHDRHDCADESLTLP